MNIVSLAIQLWMALPWEVRLVVVGTGVLMLLMLVFVQSNTLRAIARVRCQEDKE